MKTSTSAITAPYPGLRPFRMAESDLFFGRHKQVGDMLTMLETRRFLAVVGSSGSGKSSLVRAGLLPAITDGFLSVSSVNPDAEPGAWHVVTMMPGNAPFRQLASAIVKDVEGLELQGNALDHRTAWVESRLRAGSLGLTNALLETGLPQNDCVVVLVDQFEELFRFRQSAELTKPGVETAIGSRSSRTRESSDRSLTTSATEIISIEVQTSDRGAMNNNEPIDESPSQQQQTLQRLHQRNDANAFVNLLMDTADQQSMNIFVIMTMRSDFLGDCESFLGFPELISRCQYLTPRASRLELEDAIRGPLRQAGMDIEQDLVTRILNDVGADRDLLPLMQHALLQTWHRRSGNSLLSIADYESVGGFEHALDQQADTIYESLAVAQCSPTLRGGIQDAEPIVVPARRDSANEAGADRSVRGANNDSETPTPDQHIARQIFVALAETTADGQLIRRPAKVKDIAAVAGVPAARVLPVVRAFSGEGCNFLIWRPSGELTVDSSLDISHESLLRQWTRLRIWIQEESEAAEKYRRLNQDAAEYAAGHRKELDEIELPAIDRWWTSDWKPTPDWAKRCSLPNGRSADFATTEQFLQKSRNAVAAEKLAEQHRQEHELRLQREKTQAIRRWLIAVGSIAMIAIAVSLWAFLAERRANVAEIEAKEAADTANTEREKADKERDNAGLNAKLANAEAMRADSLLERSEHLLYASQIRAAEQSYESGNADRCRQLLDSCRWDYRGFDHYELSELVRPWHSDAVNSVSFSPDGKQIVSGSGDSTLKVWDAATGTEVRTLTGHSVTVSSVSFSPDGKQIVSGSWDGTLKVWEAATGTEVRTLTGHSGTVSSVSFSPDGKQIVSGSDDNTLKVWEAATGTEVRTLTGHSGYVSSVSFSPDGKQIVSGSRDNTLKVWEAATGTEVRTLTGHSGDVVSVSFSPDGKQIVSGSYDNTLKVWDAATGTEVRTLTEHSGTVSSVSFSPDGKQIVSGSGDSTLKVWDAATGTEVRTLTGHSGDVVSVSFSPDGKQIVSGSYDNTLKVWEAATGTEVRTLTGHSSGVLSVSFSPDGKQIVSGSGDDTLKVWEAATGTEVRTLTGHSDAVNSVSFSPDGKQFVSGSWDGTLKVWEAATGTEVRTLTGHSGYVSSVSFSPDGKQIVSGSWDNTLKVWDAATGTEVRTLTGHSVTVSSVSFSADGKQIVSGSSDSTLKVWDAATGTELRTLTGHSDTVSSVSFSPDGKQIVSGSRDNTLKVWEAATGTEVRTLTGHSGTVRSVSFSPDGKQIVSGSYDNTLKVWDAATGTEVRTLTGHSGDVVSVSFSPDGKQIVSGSDDNTLKVWDGSRRRVVLPVATGTVPVFAACLTPDETIIASGKQNGLLQIWDGLSGQLIVDLPGNNDEVAGHSDEVRAVAANPIAKIIADSNKPPNLKDLETPEKLHRMQQLATGSKDKTVRLWDVEIRNRRFIKSTETILRLEPSQEIWKLAYSSDGALIAAGGSLGKVQIWNSETHELAWEVQAHASYVKSLQFTDNDSKLVSSGWKGNQGPTEFRVWDLTKPAKTQQSITALYPTLVGNWHSGVALHNELFAVGNSKGEFLIHDRQSTAPSKAFAVVEPAPVDEETGEMPKPVDLRAIAFSPDGELLATAGDDNIIRLWNTSTGERVAVLSEHTGPVNSLQFYQHKARDKFDEAEPRLLSCGNDGTIRVWLIGEILKHRPVPVPGFPVPMPKVVEDSAQGLAPLVDAAVDTMDETASAHESSDPPVASVKKRPAKSLGHRPLAIVVGILAVFAVLLTLAARRRDRTRPLDSAERSVKIGGTKTIVRQ